MQWRQSTDNGVLQSTATSGVEAMGSGREEGSRHQCQAGPTTPSAIQTKHAASTTSSSHSPLLRSDIWHLLVTKHTLLLV